MDQGSIFSIFWVLLLVFSLVPFLRQRRLEFSRLNLMRSIEKKRGSRLVALIHRQETMSFLGFPISRYIDIEDSEQVLRDRLSEEDSRELARKLSDGRWTHDHPLMCEALQSMGLPVSCQVPEDVYLLMEYYPQPVRKTPSVEFVPVPYKKGKEV